MPCIPVPRRLPALLAASLLALAATAPIASAAVGNRISAAVNDNSRVALPDSVHPRVALANDLGPTPADTRLVGMTIRFNMTPAQSAALDQLLANLQDPSSPQYHQWLTPAQFAAQFGMSSDDLAQVSAWLTSQGFNVTGVAQGGTFITFDGTVAQAQAAFATSIHSLTLNGETHFANVTSISVPRALSGVVSGVTGLHNFRFKPHLHTSVVSPQFTSAISGSHFLAPGDLYTIYDINPLLTNVTNPITGAGVTIAVVGQVDINLADVKAFRSASGLNTTNLPTTVHEGGDPGAARSCGGCFPSQSDLDESSIDVEWSGAIAPGASILFVNGPDVFNNAMTQAIDQNLAPIVSASYGECEAGWGSVEMNIMNQLFKQGNAQGQTILTASGDEGATDCEGGTSAIEGLNTDFPSTSPYVTSMGGTSFNEGNATFTTQYWNSNSAGTTNNAGSAISYIPETIWNDSSINNFAGGGGGASAFFIKPAWQVGTGVPADGARDIPDLALSGSDSHDTFLYCVNVASGQSCGNGFRVVSADPTLNNNLTAAGGTSFDSQIFAGMLALVEQKIAAHGLGNANPVIYALANKTAYYNPGQNFLNNQTVVFNDVTVGNNSMPCVVGTPSCPNIPVPVVGYSAGPGYDLASGWGSVNVYNLANAWNAVTPLGLGSLGPNLSSTALTASSAYLPAGSGSTLTATVTGMTVTSTGTQQLTTVPGPTPTGAVQFYQNGTAIGAPVTLNASGVATYQLATSCANVNQQLLLTAAYTGSPTYQGSIGPALATGETGLSGGAGQTLDGTVIVNPLIVSVAAGTCPTFTINPTASSVTTSTTGAPIAATFTVASVNGFAGTVTLYATLTEGQATRRASSSAPHPS